MINKTVSILLFIVVINNIQAQPQQFTITNDSLRVHFKQESPYLVYDYYNRNWPKDIDYKALYYDEEMKNYLMKWFDEDEIINYHLLDKKRRIYGQYYNDMSRRESFISVYGYNSGIKLNVDSIISDTILTRFYFEQAVMWNLEKEKKDLLKNREKLCPLGVMFHANVPYPETYKKIKDLWYKHGKTITPNLLVFLALVKMNDSEAQAKFDKIITDYINSDVVGQLPYFEGLDIVDNAYALKKLVELLPEQRIVFDFVNYSLDKYTYEHIKYRFNRYQLDTKWYSDIETMRKNEDEIVKAAKELIKKMEEEEKYWMENMPFDYVPNRK